MKKKQFLSGRRGRFVDKLKDKFLLSGNWQKKREEFF
jgi:hypothetical protein